VPGLVAPTGPRRRRSGSEVPLRRRASLAATGQPPGAPSTRQISAPCRSLHGLACETGQPRAQRLLPVSPIDRETLRRRRRRRTWPLRRAQVRGAGFSEMRRARGRSVVGGRSRVLGRVAAAGGDEEVGELGAGMMSSFWDVRPQLAERGAHSGDLRRWAGLLITFDAPDLGLRRGANMRGAGHAVGGSGRSDTPQRSM
jgi:hypothetical protein